MGFIQINIVVPSVEISDIIVAQLSLLGFSGFEERATELLGCIAEGNFEEDKVQEVLHPLGLPYSKTYIKEQNWNALWESNFEPVVVNDFCAIRADFHQPFTNVAYDLVINPKMSFGTGHHATTYLMIEQMSKMEFRDKHIADFGTGTGILAILAEKLAALKIEAIDEDEWSMENAAENISRNNCHKITLVKSNAFTVESSFDVILANINRNVILNNIERLSSGLLQGGKLLLSGLYKEDRPDVLNACQRENFVHVSTVTRDNWICMLMDKLV